MQKDKELRFNTFIDEHTECQVYATIENGDPIIHAVNVVGDCAVTMDDLDDESREFFMSEVRRVMAESQKL